MFTRFLTALALTLTFSAVSYAQVTTSAPEQNLMDELDPFDPNIESQLEEMDAIYEQETGMSPFVDTFTIPFGPKCRQISCPVFIRIKKSVQTAYLYRDGSLVSTWLVSTGVPGRGTPDFEGNPNGRIYDKYTSSKYPEGDYKGLGNMPYAVFYKGGFAIHGTTMGNFKRLGQKASHGCTRLHPDNGFTFNRLVRQYGIYNVWISIVEQFF